MALTDLVLMPGAHYQDICDAIREKNGQSGVIVSGDAGDLIRAIQTSTGSNIELPEGVYRFKMGTWSTTSSLTSTNTKIEHNLGYTPNFFCIFAIPGNTVASAKVSCAIGTSQSGMIMRRGTSSNTTGGALVGDSTTVGMGSGTYYYQENIPYIWIVGYAE